MMFSLLAVAALVASVNACGEQKIANYPGNSFIVGGRDARPGSWPWQVQILVSGRQYCGGTVIGKRWVLTAAHCVEGYTSRPSRYTLAFGSHQKSRKDSTQVNIVPNKIVSHPRYNRRTLDYDFALFRLPSDLQFNNYIQPACIASSDPNSGTNCYTTGWGDVQGTGNANVLKQAMVPLISNSQCNSLYYRNQITGNMMCAGYSRGGIDACQGDSGGPLVCKVGSRWSVVGATSWGEGCAKPNRPGVYARVSAVRSWILSEAK